MRTRAAIILAALASLAASAAGAAPYPASGLVTGVSWDTATYRSAGAGGDLWPVTAGADGTVYTAWGDGTVTCPAKVSYGVASVAGGPSADLRRVGCGTPGDKAGKLISLLDVAGTLFAVAYLQGRPDTGAVAVWSSPDHGRTWRKPGPTFPGAAGALQPDSFVKFGPGYAGARDGYVYLTATKAGTAPRAFYLMRAPRAGLQDGAAYEYFAGTAAAPAWGGSPAAAGPVFADPRRRERPGRGPRRGPGPVPGDGRARRRRQRRGRARGVRGARAVGAVADRGLRGALARHPDRVRQAGVNSSAFEVAIGHAAWGGIWAGSGSAAGGASSAMASTCM